MELKENDVIVNLHELKAEILDMYAVELAESEKENIDIFAGDMLEAIKVLDIIERIGRKE